MRRVTPVSAAAATCASARTGSRSRWQWSSIQAMVTLTTVGVESTSIEPYGSGDAAPLSELDDLVGALDDGRTVADDQQCRGGASLEELTPHPGLGVHVERA